MRNATTRRIRVAEVAATPWKNGGGVTRELATGGGAGADWGWRLSLAEVAQDGPFSAFPGVDRIIAVIDGAGMDLLRPDGSTLALEPFQPVRFAGEDPLTGRRRDGPVRDLNVMVRRGAFDATMSFLHGPAGIALEGRDGDCALVLALAGGCTAYVEGARHDLQPGEALLHEGGARVNVKLDDGGVAALIRITAR